MKNILFLAVIVTFLSTSCGRRVVIGRGEVVTETRTLTGFSQIEISAPVTTHIHVQEGAQTSVQFSGYKNMLEEIKTTVDGNTLHIDSKRLINFDTDKNLTADITVSSLSDLEIHGAADADVDGNIRGEGFRLKVSGAGNVTVDNLEVSQLEATISGVGDVTIHSGKANSIEYKVSGAGNINSFGVMANDVKAKVSGTGDIQVNAAKTLDAKVSGAGSIRYKGNPSVKSQTSGVGEVIAAN